MTTASIVQRVWKLANRFYLLDRVGIELVYN